MKNRYICFVFSLLTITCNAGNADTLHCDSLNSSNGASGNDAFFGEITSCELTIIILLLVVLISVVAYVYMLNKKMKQLLMDEIDDIRNEFRRIEKNAWTQSDGPTVSDLNILSRRVQDVEGKMDTMVGFLDKYHETEKLAQQPLKGIEQIPKIFYAAEPMDKIFNHVSDKFIQGRSVFEITINEDGKTGTFKVCDDVTTMKRALKNNLFDSSCRTTGSKIEASSVVNEVLGIVQLGANGYWTVEHPAEIKFN